MRTLLMGPPGAGKGTQAKRLAETLRMRHLSSGDIFRAERAAGSALGEELGRYMDSGELVPDEVVVEVMAKAVAAGDAEAGLLLDGFPRTVPQAEALDEQLGRAGTPLDAVAVIVVPDEAVVERITGRRSCPCGQVYHVEYLRPKQDGVCDKCGAALIQREDDTQEVVRQRLAAYHAQTQPVIAYYKQRGRVKVLEIDGAPGPDDVTAAMVEALGALHR